MKKNRNKILIPLLIAVLIIGLFSGCAKEDGPVWEWDKMTKSFQAKVSGSWLVSFEYCGTYNGWIVYGTYCDLMPMYTNIAGYVFDRGKLAMHVYRDDVRYSLQEAYEQGILSKKQIGYIHTYLCELYPAEMKGVAAGYATSGIE